MRRYGRMSLVETPSRPPSPLGGFPGPPGPPPFPFLPFHEGTSRLPPRLPGGRFPVDVVPAEMLPLLAAGALSVVSQMFRRWNTRAVEADWGMTGPRVSVLVMLAQARSLTMGEIASTLEVTPRAVTRLVDGLEAEGYVIRARDPHDKRVVHVTCTQRALAFAEERMPALADRMAALFADFTPEQLRGYVAVITTVGERIRSELELGSGPPAAE